MVKDNRAFCKYICPVTVFLKLMSYFSLLRENVIRTSAYLNWLAGAAKKFTYI